MAALYFSPDFVDTVRDSSPLAEVAAEYVKLRKHGKNFQGCCPFHDDKTPSFSINPEKDLYTCFSGCSGSGGSGDVFAFVMRKENLSFAESVEFLAKRSSLQIPKPASYKKSPLEIERENTLSSIAKSFSENAETFKDEFEKLCESLLINPAKLKAAGFNVGFTHNSATQIAEAFNGQEELVVQHAKKVGLLTATGQPPFDDNSVSVFLGESAEEGIAFINQNGAFVTLPSNMQQRHNHVFGLAQFKSNAITLVDGAKQCLGKSLFVASNPLLALQMVSVDVKNVIAPFQASSIGFEGFNKQIIRLSNAISEVHVKTIMPTASTDSTDMARFVARQNLIRFNSIILTDESIKTLAPLLNSTNDNESLDAALEDNPTLSEALRLQNPITFLGDFIIKKAISECGITDADEMLNSKKKPLILALDLLSSELSSDHQDKQTILNCALRTLGLTNSDVISVQHPDIGQVSSERNRLCSLLFGSATSSLPFAQKLIDETTGLLSDEVPDFLSGSEKMLLMFAAQETIINLSQPNPNPKSHILNLGNVLFPDDIAERQRFNNQIKETLTFAKTSNKSINDIGTESLTLLSELMRKATCSLTLAINYQPEPKIETEQKLEIIQNLNNTLFKQTRGIA